MRVLVVANFFMSYNRSILHGAASYARLHKWTLTYTDARWGTAAERLKEIDALLLGVHDFETDSDWLKSKLPRVGWSASQAKTPWPRVLTDNIAVGHRVAEHFLASGYRHFAFCPNWHGIWSTSRLEGFQSRLQAAGYSVAVAPAGADVTAEWLKTLSLPCGLMVSRDSSVEAVLAECSRASLRVPEDVAIVGVGNDELVCEITDPPLSSVPHQSEQIGYQAAAILDRLVHDRSYKPPEITLIPPGELVVRRSSDAMVFDDPMLVEAMRFIKANQSETIGTKQVVSHVGTSRVTLDTKFMAAMGMTVAAVIRRMRIDKAKLLLSSSDLPMPAVARHSGFSCARQLSKTFHHYTGHTPTGYRRLFMLGG